MEDKGTEPVKVEALEQVEVKAEPPVEVDCLLDYNLGTQLTVEQEIQIGDGPPCLDYDVTFLARKTPKPRQRRVSGQRNYNCTRCGKSFLRCSDLVKHEKTHTDERLYACNICGKNFRRHTSLLIHERIHTGERPYQCTQCGKSFVQRQHLTTHLRTHTGEKPYRCIDCGKGFRWRSELLKHQKIHTEKSGVGFDDLAASFSKEEWMELEEWQKELYRNVMKETSETLISLGEGLVEKAISEKPPEHVEPAPCLAGDCGGPLPLCPEEAVACSNPLGGEGSLCQTLDIAEGKAFTDGVDKIRMKFLDRANGSSSEQAHACAECGNVFYNKRTLKAHLRGHLGERSYICNVCGKCFSRHTSLIIHERIHTGERPYQCTQCGKSFIQRQHLNTHLKTHTGEKAFQCGQCPKGFRWRSELAKHQKIHEEETGDGEVADASIKEEHGDSNTFQDQEAANTDSVPLTPTPLANQKSAGRRRPSTAKVEKAHACAECGKVFYNKRTLKAHLRDHLGERSYICNVCGKCFRRHTALIIHERIHTGERPYKCLQCDKSFIQKQHLTTHNRTHTGEKPFPCPVCGKSYRWRSELVKHQKIHEEEQNGAGGSEAGQRESTGRKRRHKREASGGAMCALERGKALGKRARLLLRQRAQKAERALSCPDCSKTFLNKRTLRTHQRVHTDERSYICNVCGKSFRRHTSLLIHERIHTGERPYQCAQCGKSFVQRQHLTTHLRTHTGEKAFQCAQCPKGFRWRSELAKHQKIHEEHEEGLLSTADPTCKKETENFLDDDWKAITSAQNQQSQKNGEAPEKVVTLGRPRQEELHHCTQCDKAFLRSSDLTRHQRSHLEERPYVCNQCGKCFRRNTSLLIHERIHTGERPYQCAQCGKSFVQRQHLTTHLRTHTGEKPFPCTLCRKSYRWRSELLKHQRVHNNEVAVTFDDVAVCFSDDWKDLEEWQKELYRNMMKESADSLVSLVWINKNGKELPPEKAAEELELSSDCKDPLPLGADAVCELRDFPGEEPHSSSDVLRGFRPGLHFLEQRLPPREKLFLCNQCEKRFARSSDLLKHQRSHQGGDKPNLCNDCGKIFRRRTALLVHKRIHTGERPYKCKQCGKCFVQRQHLTTHVKTHTGERPYPCSECGKSYRWRSELNKHQKVHADLLSSTMEYTQG